METRRGLMLVVAALVTVAVNAIPLKTLARDPVQSWKYKPLQKAVFPAKYYAPHLQEEEGYNETWSYAIRFDSGHVLFAKFLITNLGPGDKKIAVTAHMIGKGGDLLEIRNGAKPGEWDYHMNTKRLRFHQRHHHLKAFPPKFTPLDAAILGIVDGTQIDVPEAGSETPEREGGA